MAEIGWRSATVHLRYPALVPEPHLDWDGCFNARDLGGLRARGGQTRRGALVRADALDRLSADGWRSVVAHGVRTIIDLRNDDEIKADLCPRPAELTTLHMPLDAVEDLAFWAEWGSGWQFGTPLYYGPHLLRHPGRSAAVVAAVARARPGGVVIHCGVGRDRTGMIAMLLLWLVGVSPADIAADHGLSHARLAPLFALRGEPDQGPIIEQFLASKQTTTAAILEQTLASLDLARWMSGGPLSSSDLEALGSRLVG